MSSRSLVAGAALLLLGAVLACGRKADPQPPPLKHPARTLDLAIQQRGAELILTFTYPRSTAGGLALEEVAAVEYWELVQPLPEPVVEEEGAEEEESEEGMAAAAEGEPEAEGAEGEPEGEETEPQTPAEEGEASGDIVEIEEPEMAPPAPEEREEVLLIDEEPRTEVAAAPQEGQEVEEEGEDEEAAEEPEEEEPAPPAPEELVLVDLREFDRSATLRLTLAGAELEGAVSGDKIVMRLPFELAEEREARVYAVKTTLGGKLESDFSNLAILVPRQPPPAPADFAVEPEQAGVRLSWSEGGEEVLEYRIYRRDAESRSYGPALRVVAAGQSEHLDRGASFGGRYIYAVAAVGNLQPLVESSFSTEREVSYRDLYPPPAPGGLAALADEGQVRLIWDASEADDVQGYLVYRRQPAGEPQPLNEEPMQRLEYLDRAVAAGATYLYRVVAVDGEGNRSEPSGEAEARIP